MRITVVGVLIAGLSVASVVSATPDLSGPWEIGKAITALKTVEGKAPPLTAEGKKMQQENQANLEMDPIKSCLPPGIPRVLMQKDYPFSIVIGEAMGGMFIEWNHLPRPIYMNVEHFENIGPTYLGQAVAKWDDDTLVIDTNGYNERTWLDGAGLPHTEDLHTVERVRLKDANTLEDQITFTDAKVFSKPWTAALVFKKREGYIVKEDYCFGRTGQGKTKSVSK